MKKRYQVIGVDLGGTNIQVGKVRDGKIETIIEAATPHNPWTAQETIDALISVIQNVFSEDIQAIGIGVPSVVDRKKGIVYNVVNIPYWDEVPIKKILEKHFGIPVYVDNDANCFALGEHLFGVGKKIKNFVGLTIGTGLGGGIIHQGELLDGSNCGAGEFGMIPYKDHILEYYCSGSLFQNMYQIDGKEMYLRAQNEDSAALMAFEQLGYHIAQAIQIVMYAIDPEMIVLGGSVAKAHPYFEKSMWYHLKQFAYPKSVERIQIRFSELQNSGVLGAAAIAVKGVSEN